MNKLYNLICSENHVFLRNKFGTGLLPRCAPRNDVSSEGGKKEVVVAPLLPPVVIASRAKQSSANNAFRRNAALLRKNYITYFGCLVFLLSATPVRAEMALPSLTDIQKKKADLFIEQQRLLSEAETLEKNLRNLALLHGEKKENVEVHQKTISTNLPLLARLGRSNPTRILVDPANAQDTIRGITLVRAFTSSLKHQIQEVQAELINITALSQELENKSQSHQQLLQGIELQQAQLSALEHDHIASVKKSELDRLSKEEDINTLLDESRAALSKTGRASTAASKSQKLPFRWLERPVAGKMINDSALQNKFSPHSQGVLFQTQKNAEVAAPSKGKVVFKGPFRNQGDILMLDHGGKVYTVLMGMDKIDAQVGQKVYAGEKLGIMPGYGTSKPVLYLELRQKGKAIDPKPYFAD